ncbi:uncharacterized protein FFMR_04065 [Fusarium fujikuroi]|nr:uncharacterized protein FFE2_02487 [Fusarium fujikuroi]SCO36397.1 uncharacterized protein FFMR_04065 [Fusarium fujikuroi]SCV37210.1 uncharacterized protein FFFS_05551 [Fusarium fujikuroi]SCV45545.1 uncharacterized protein FFB14_08713 [Fusarium fujikuroi]
MPPSQRNATTGKKETSPSTQQKPEAHGSKEQVLEWLRQSDEDEPWRGFTVVAKDGESHVYSAQNPSQTWSTRAEVGSQHESSTG